MARVTAEHVRSIPHFARLSERDALALAARLVLREYGVRELVAVEGEPAHGFFQLVGGRARLFRTGPEGREQIMRLLQPGDTFGEVAVFDEGPAPASVETIEPSSVLLVPAEVFRGMITSHPEVAMDLLAHFARRLRAFTELVEQISLQTVQQRVARYLYLSAREEGTPAAEGVVVPRTLTLQDLAALVGSVREVVSRTLHALQEDGIIEVRRTEFVVKDIALLRSLL